MATPRSSLQRTVAAFVLCSVALVLFFQVSVVPHASTATVPRTLSANHPPLGREGFGSPPPGPGYKDGGGLSRPAPAASPAHGETKLSASVRWGNIAQCEAVSPHVVYWRDDAAPHPLDRGWSSPYPLLDGSEGLSSAPKFVTFEPDSGGWNNIRMSLESVLVFAVATGRVLVLPPPYRIYLLGHGGAGGEFEFHHVFDSFYRQGVYEWYTPEAYRRRLAAARGDPSAGDVRSLAPLAVTMADFLETYGPGAGVEAAPPELLQRIKGEEDPRLWRKALWNWLPEARGVQLWARDGDGYFVTLFGTREGAEGGLSGMDEAMRGALEAFGHGKQGIDYSASMQRANVIHFSGAAPRPRLLRHWYAFLFFPEPQMRRRMQRVARDVLRYSEDIFCRAAAVVSGLGGARSYAAIHVRRGDFQYKAVKVDTATVARDIEDLVRPNETLYVATDVRNKTYFDPLRRLHGGSVRLAFLSDFPEAGRGAVNPNHFGMIEQIVLARARLMVGTYYSTFTAYATRMRGWYAVHDGIGRPSADGAAVPGAGTNTYYVPRKFRDALGQPGVDPPRGPSFVREFRYGYEGIDP